MVSEHQHQFCLGESSYPKSQACSDLLSQTLHGFQDTHVILVHTKVQEAPTVLMEKESSVSYFPSLVQQILKDQAGLELRDWSIEDLGDREIRFC